MTLLWTPTTVGAMQLPHRLAMAPMTRDRALPDGTPGPSAARYYAQRASLGLLITEGTQPSEDGQGYLLTPGLHTDEHVRGWREVADAVHAEGGHLVVQLMHAGRLSHPDNTPHGRQSVAPSAIASGTQMFTAEGMKDAPEPRALTTDEVRATVDDFRQAARRAVDAGIDAVEIHGANGYLVQQFLAEASNARTDEYGGSPSARAQFAIQVVRAVVDEIGAARTAIRISPAPAEGGVDHAGIDEGETSREVYRHLIAGIAPLRPAYLHVMHHGDDAFLKEIRELWPTTLIVNRPGRDRDTIADDVDAGLADVVSIGARALANPDLAHRLRTGADLNEPDRASFFGGGDEGYVDYPALTTS
ncbi:alkene reductase [Luteipulveratus halotolerans]|uniref:1,2-oxophytodienoate reductase n=1 Tax=Luteipulveratus halotolerans TaxID=1631356 RepID=A0A0L6CMQ9_9MICO|nr:alkene reductase [Luteipulveratus halotolerans]KNX38838.1 1,2-oxophytodienoate reductase [Luteipulveratus halotolerans]